MYKAPAPSLVAKGAGALSPKKSVDRPGFVVNQNMDRPSLTCRVPQAGRGNFVNHPPGALKPPSAQLSWHERLPSAGPRAHASVVRKVPGRGRSPISLDGIGDQEERRDHCQRDEEVALPHLEAEPPRLEGALAAIAGVAAAPLLLRRAPTMSPVAEARVAVVQALLVVVVVVDRVRVMAPKTGMRAAPVLLVIAPAGAPVGVARLAVVRGSATAEHAAAAALAGMMAAPMFLRLGPLPLPVREGGITVVPLTARTRSRAGCCSSTSSSSSGHSVRRRPSAQSNCTRTGCHKWLRTGRCSSRTARACR